MGDLISRSALMHEIEKYFRDSKAITDDVLNLVCMMPSVDAVEVVHGEWKSFGLASLKCSKCKYVDDLKMYHNFCPNCGAKMDGERKGDDA